MLNLLSHPVVLRIGFLIALIGAWLPSEAYASNLPQCTGDYFDNCQGTFTWPDGSKYVGEWKDSKNNGQGTLTMANGDKYVGEFKNHKTHGRGTITFANGDKYVGEWKDHKHHGQGTYTSANGDKYIGEWKDGKSNGQGTYTTANGDKYVGEYKDSKRNGQGTYKLANGQKYVGEWKDDNPNGKGTYTWPTGGKYVGEFKDNKRNGEGVLYAANGSIINMGIWANGEFIKEANVEPESPVVPKKKQKNTPKTAEGSSGTAFRIAPGQFVTNHHVVENCKIMMVGGKQGGSVLEIDPKNDLALISVPNDSGETASIRTTRTVLNEAVTAAGFPLQGAFSGIAITNGTVSRLSGLQGDTGQIQISAPVQPGNSGGPLVDSAGNVIGVVSGKLNALKVAGAIGDIPQNINFAIGGNILRAFLDAKGINYKEASRGEDLRGEQIAALASSFTVLVECK
jgi:hypothetical protein